MTRCIYIVEDVDSVRASLHSLLALRSDQVVFGFSSGDAFLADAGVLHPGVLLLDLHLPGTGGMAVLGTLCRLHQGKFAPLILTGQLPSDLGLAAVQAGALEILEKPYQASALLDTIDLAFSRLAKDSADAARATARKKVAGLSTQEREVLRGLIGDCDTGVISGGLNATSRAVQVARTNLLAKLGVDNRSAALRIAFVAGMVPRPSPMD